MTSGSPPNPRLRRPALAGAAATIIGMVDDPGMLTAAEIGTVQFGRPPWGKRGYHKGEVDVFLELIALRLERRTALTAEDIHHAAFSRPPIGRRGYDEEQVDALLDRAEATVAALERLSR